MSLTNLVLLQNSALLGPAGQAIPVDIQCELGKVNFMYFFHHTSVQALLLP